MLVRRVEEDGVMSKKGISVFGQEEKYFSHRVLRGMTLSVMIRRTVLALMFGDLEI